MITFSSPRTSRRRAGCWPWRSSRPGPSPRCSRRARIARPPPQCSTGMECETATPTAPVFNLDATAGYIRTPDGNSIYMWSYAASGRGFQLPGPTLCVDVRRQGDGRAAQHAARGDVHRVPRADHVTANGRRPSRSRPAGDSTRPATSTSLVRPRPPGRDGHLHVHRRAHRAPTSTSRAPTSPSSGRWASTARSSSGRPARTKQANNTCRARRSSPSTSTCSCCPRSTPTAPGGRAAPGLQLHKHGSLLHDQRPEHARHPGPEQRGLAAQPAVRRDRPRPAVRRDRQPGRGPHPLPERRAAGLPVPPARQRRDGHHPRRRRAADATGQDATLRQVPASTWHPARPSTR